MMKDEQPTKFRLKDAKLGSNRGLYQPHLTLLKAENAIPKETHCEAKSNAPSRFIQRLRKGIA